MRGPELSQSSMFSYVSIEDRIPQDHPLRSMRRMLDPVLNELSPRFAALYSHTGRPSIPPEQLLRALLLQILYTIRSERQLMEQLDYNLLFRWFVGLNPDDPIWVPTVFTKNRDRLLDGNIAEAFFNAVLKHADSQALLSHDHFTIDGTLLEAWASHKSFRPIEDRKSSRDDDEGPGVEAPPSNNPDLNFRGEKRSNLTHRSTTDPDARLAKKSAGSRSMLAYQASVVMENRNGLIVGTDVRSPSYQAEREAAVEMLTMLEPRGGRVRQRRRTVGADKGYDREDFVSVVRTLGFTPHIGPNVHARRYRSPIDCRTMRHPGFLISQRKRKLVEESFGWGKVVGSLRKLHHRGRDLIGWIFTFTTAAYNLVRMRRLLDPQPCT